MKLWEWTTFSAGLLSALAADSSVTWCLILAFVCMFSIVMINVSKGIEEDVRKAFDHYLRNRHRIRNGLFYEPWRRE